MEQHSRRTSISFAAGGAQIIPPLTTVSALQRFAYKLVVRDAVRIWLISGCIYKK